MQQTIGKYRWTICGLLFFATTVNYLDRSVISMLKPYLASAFKWTPAQEAGDYADIEMAFKLSYAIGMLFAGRIIDKLGTKIGYALATGLWSIAAICHALTNGTLGLGIARSFLGITESGNFPAAIKAVAEWFPRKERALATGIFNSGANIGAIIVPLTVPLIAEQWNWRWAFILTGLIGLIWLVLWFIFYEVPRKQKKLSGEELVYIESDKEDVAAMPEEDTQPKISWAKLLAYRQTWAFAVGKFLTDPVWWFYLFWLPDFLRKQYHLTSREIMWPTAVVYIISSIGSIGGGWLPLRLINNNWPVFKARKTSMLIYAFCVIPIVFAQQIGNMGIWFAVMIIGLAAAAHQAWSANIFTTVSDMFPKRATASVTGIGGLFGGIGGVLLTLLVQKRMFVHYESIGKIQTGYFIMFLICGGAYLTAWLIMHFLVPKMKRIEV
jgi:ACS family hexuronate transporter-like MFS transporter